MKLRKAPIGNLTLQRLDQSLAEDLLTEAYSSEEIADQLRAIGGDPEAIGERGQALVKGLLGNADLHSRPGHLSTSPFGGVPLSERRHDAFFDSAKRDFAFRQLLRAYRAGIISYDTFSLEQSSLESAASEAGRSTFKAFGKTYASEREAVIDFLEAITPAEVAASEAIREWLQTCQIDCIKGGLKMVAEREGYHGRAFAERLIELGRTVPASVRPEIRESIDYLRDTNLSDLEKLQRTISRYPNPEDAMQPLFEFISSLQEDQQTKEMLRLFAADELSTLRWQNTLCVVLTEMKRNGQIAA
ncbi:MAG: hypothetical protein JO189_20760 [Deltaproteobacteria bacterium]|nr:hypothetical protein [Deltaproteobacteria bacterium]